MVWQWLKEKFNTGSPSAKPLKTSRSFLQDIQICIERELQKRFALFEIIPLEDHDQNGIARTKEGKVFVKFFLSQNSHAIQRSLFTHSLLKQHDINVPELLWADTNPQNLQKYQVCCFANRWKRSLKYGQRHHNKFAIPSQQLMLLIVPLVILQFHY